MITTLTRRIRKLRDLSKITAQQLSSLEPQTKDLIYRILLSKLSVSWNSNDLSKMVQVLRDFCPLIADRITIESIDVDSVLNFEVFGHLLNEINDRAVPPPPRTTLHAQSRDDSSRSISKRDRDTTSTSMAESVSRLDKTVQEQSNTSLNVTLDSSSIHSMPSLDEVFLDLANESVGGKRLAFLKAQLPADSSSSFTYSQNVQLERMVILLSHQLNRSHDFCRRLSNYALDMRDTSQALDPLKQDRIRRFTDRFESFIDGQEFQETQQQQFKWLTSDQFNQNYSIAAPSDIRESLVERPGMTWLSSLDNLLNLLSSDLKSYQARLNDFNGSVQDRRGQGEVVATDKELDLLKAIQLDSKEVGPKVDLLLELIGPVVATASSLNALATT